MAMVEKTYPTTTEQQDIAPDRERTRNEERYIAPPVDIYEENDTLKVVADLPGVDKDCVGIQVYDNILTIQGKPAHKASGNPVYGEFELVNFFRQFELSEAVDSERISANLENGVLTLTLPKAEKAKPRQIAVSVS